MNPESGTVFSPFLYGADDKKLERFFLLGPFVAGKHAGIQQQKLDGFLVTIGCLENKTPFERLRHLWNADQCPKNIDGTAMQTLACDVSKTIPWALRHVKAGQYVRLTRLLYRIAELTEQHQLDIRTASREQLCCLPGYGMKTASFFTLYTRPSERVACLDVHLLRFMEQLRLAPRIPSSTPANPVEYLRLERAFLHYCQDQGRDPAELDFEIWSENSKTMTKRPITCL